jgi:DNA-binding transcriptional LysR family regulator
MIEIRLLEHALAVADGGSFALAAQSLGISQPALSRSIQSLEAQLALQLFERSHRRIEPTDAGQLFLERARDLVARHADLSREMGLVEQHTCPSFTLAVGPYVAELIAGTALARMLASADQVQWRLRVESWTEVVKRVRSREAELGVADISQIDDDPELEITPLDDIQGYFMVRRDHPLLKNPLLKNDSPTLDKILTYPLVCTSRLPPRLFGPLQESRGSNGSVKGGFPSVVCELISIMRTIVCQSDSVGIFTLPLVERDLVDGTLVPIREVFPWLHTQFGIIKLRKSPLSAHGQQLANCIQQVAAEVAAKARLLAGADLSD